MRIKRDYNPPKHGDVRKVRRFAFLPKKLINAHVEGGGIGEKFTGWIWWEFYTETQRYFYDDSLLGELNGEWDTIAVSIDDEDIA